MDDQTYASQKAAASLPSVRYRARVFRILFQITTALACVQDDRCVDDDRYRAGNGRLQDMLRASYKVTFL